MENLESDKYRLISFSRLPNSYGKLLKRICNLNKSGACKIPENIGGIIDLDVNYFSSLPSVGELYVSSLIELKNELCNGDILHFNNPIEEDDFIGEFCIIPSSLSTLHFNFQFLSKQEIKLLDKFENLYGSMSVKDIVDFDVADLKSLKGIGNLHSETLLSLQSRIRSELKRMTENGMDFKFTESSIFTSSEIRFYEMNKIDKFLLEDVESYLWSLDDRRQDIALSRWGFNHRYETLEEIGERYSFTRERVRQIEKKTNARLPLFFRIHPKVLWKNIQANISAGLTSRLPNLAKCFESERTFFSFLEECCQIESGSVSQMANPDVKRKILDSLFCENPSPISRSFVISELISEFGYTQILAEITIKKLEEAGVLKSDERGIEPQDLGAKEAIAHVLTFHPEGLPWKDIARIISIKGYSKHVSGERMSHGFNDSDYIYLCGPGTYRHRMFLDIDQLNIDLIFEHLIAYFGENNIQSLNLHDYYSHTINERVQVEYFTLRHIIKEYGEAVDIYFNGRSSVDNVSLSKNGERITQKEVIIQSLNRAKGAMTKAEIAEKLRSKSLDHASYYLNVLMDEGKVVRVDQLMYTIPEKAFKNINQDKVLSFIGMIVNSTNLVIESDIIREKANLEFDLSYSKYFYSALIGTNLASLGCYRVNNLICSKGFKYRSMRDICREVCNVNYSTAENIKKIREIVWITSPVAESALSQWRLLIS
ncbi:MAG: hypothetical protein KJ914_13735 [Gammaproteobacteria bacterium]|nr:hypothetical protein [Gammaproteobacteria bacterium]MBU1723826.1 hypothetical protein [Gammaproteobacteria bacterium]MBU2007019.1 hypothetical protein [Gammaproteobacteria bacterium]